MKGNQGKLVNDIEFDDLSESDIDEEDYKDEESKQIVEETKGNDVKKGSKRRRSLSFTKNDGGISRDNLTLRRTKRFNKKELYEDIDKIPS